MSTRCAYTHTHTQRKYNNVAVIIDAEILSIWRTDVLDDSANYQLTGGGLENG